MTNGRTDGPTKQGVESRSTRLKIKYFFPIKDKLAEQDNTIKLLQYTNDEIMTRMEELEGANFRLLAVSTFNSS